MKKKMCRWIFKKELNEAYTELMKKCKVYKEIALSQVSKEELENV